MKSQLKYLNDKDPWMLAEDIPDIDFFFSQIWLSTFVNDLKNSCGKNYKKVLAVFRPKFFIHFYYGKKDSLNFEKHLVDRIKKNHQFGFAINRNIVKWSDKLVEFSKKISNFDYQKLTNKDLAKFLEQQDKIHTNLYEWGWLSNATDMFHGTFTSHLQSYLKGKIKNDDDKVFNQTFNSLITPVKKSVATLEEENLLKIANSIRQKKGKIDKKIGIQIEKHHSRYFYLKHLWLGRNETYNKKHYVGLVKQLAKDKESPRKKLQLANKRIITARKEKNRLFRELKINKKYQNLFSIYSDFMLTKMYRRYAQIYWAYQMEKLLKRVAKRLDISLDEIRHLSFTEMIDGLIRGVVDKKEIKKRINFLLYYVEYGKELITTDRNHPILKKLKSTDIKKVNRLSGQIGCLGKAVGIVKIVNTHKDIKKIKTGEIMVSITTNPDLVPAMKKAAAIVTEQGGVTSHAAIVSRELNIPCVIGIKIATKVLKDGDKVEVDATKGLVRRIK